MLKFNKYNVRDTETNKKARIHYSVDNHISGRPCVTIYAKDYDSDLLELLSEGYENNTDIMIDYFEKGRVRMFADHPHYAAARAAATR